MAKKDRRAISLCEMCENYMKGLPCDFKDDCKIQNLFKENKRLKQKNKELRLKIRALEDDEYNYVQKLGHFIPNEFVSTLGICSVCEHPIEDGDNYCKWCGAKMDEEVTE